jgi:Cu/Zn superoxide dismutase
VRIACSILLLLTAAACAQGPLAARPPAKAASVRQASHAATPWPSASPSPSPPAATPPAPAATQAPAVPAPPPAGVFALMGAGGGSVRVTSAGGSTTVVVSATGVAPGPHATHVHRGCDGSMGAHLLYLSSVYGPSGSSTTVLQVAKPPPGWTVIVYPGPTAVGRPVLCAAIS